MCFGHTYIILFINMTYTPEATKDLSYIYKWTYKLLSENMLQKQNTNIA